MTFERRSFLLGLGACAALRPARAQSVVPAGKLIAAARAQIGVTRTYDGSYQSLTYPNGDVERARGVCTDVIIRAYRDGFGFDFQQGVHEDMRGAFDRYPALWGLSRPDRNIDHRRVPNLETYLARKGAKLEMASSPTELAPGDLLTMRLPGNLPHIAIVSDKAGRFGARYILHNIGRGAREDRLDASLQATVTSRFRYLTDLPDHSAAL